jgi:hypothetical protein
MDLLSMQALQMKILLVITSEYHTHHSLAIVFIIHRPRMIRIFLSFALRLSFVLYFVHSTDNNVSY